MGEIYTGGETDVQPSLVERRALSDVYNIMAACRPDGTLDAQFLEDMHVNYVTAVKEAAMPLAISNPYQKYRDGNFIWADGQTPEMVAESGKRFHFSEAALKRVDVEIEEARGTTPRTLKPGFLKLMVSPAMPEADAPYKIAKREHLADDDMVRMHKIDVDDEGNIKGKYMPTVALPVLSLPVWHATLQDLGAKIGKRFQFEKRDSALPVMKLHTELEFPEESLPEGIISVIEHLLPHVDTELRLKIQDQLLVLRDQEAQERMHQKAESIARRWLDFDMALADSLAKKRATPKIEQFIYQLQHQWDADAIDLIKMHYLDEGGIYMTDRLAAKLQIARRKTLWTAAGVAAGNQKVLEQLDASTARRIYEQEEFIEILAQNGASRAEIAAVEARQNRLILIQNITVGGGCAGEVSGIGKGPNSESTLLNDNPARDLQQPDDLEADNEDDTWLWKRGICRIEECPTRPTQTQVGPCDVCHSCQRIFDRGKDPRKSYALFRPSAGVSDESDTFWSIISELQTGVTSVSPTLEPALSGKS